MLKIESKNKWAIDVSFHIPVPSFSLKISRNEINDEKSLNTPLHRKLVSASLSKQESVQAQTEELCKGALSRTEHEDTQTKQTMSESEQTSSAQDSKTEKTPAANTQDEEDHG